MNNKETDKEVSKKLREVADRIDCGEAFIINHSISVEWGGYGRREIGVQSKDLVTVKIEYIINK